MARNADTDTTGVVDLKNVSSPSGAEVTNLQQHVNELASADGYTGCGDTTSKTYSSTVVIANGDSRKAALGKLDAAMNPAGTPVVVTSLVDNGANQASGKITFQGDTMISAALNSITKIMSVTWSALTMVLFSNVTMPDNTSSATVLAAATVALNQGFEVFFSVKRGAGNIQVGRIRISSDGTTSQLDPDFTEFGACGIVWSTTVETLAGNSSCTLKYTTTSTGTAAKITYEQKNFPKPS